jgi:hypothetical protein
LVQNEVVRIEAMRLPPPLLGTWDLSLALDLKPDADLNALFGDPSPGNIKFLTLNYDIQALGGCGDASETTSSQAVGTPGAMPFQSGAGRSGRWCTPEVAWKFCTDLERLSESASMSSWQ